MGERVKYFLLTTHIGGSRTRIVIGRTVGRDAPKRYTPAPPGVEWVLNTTKRDPSIEEINGYQRIVNIMNGEST